MGIVLRGKCAACGYDGSAYTGGSMWDCRPDSALSAGREDPGLKLALEQNCRWQIRRSAALCPQCHALTTAAQVDYWTAEGERRTVPPVCPVCGGGVELYRDSTQIPCPVCGEMITLVHDGHWE